MPQISKGGKYIFGWTIVGGKGIVRIPEETIREYGLFLEEKVILISGSRSSGGLAISRIGLMQKSIMNAVLTTHTELEKGSLPEGELLQYKGRQYGWVSMWKDGTIQLKKSTLISFEIQEKSQLLVIRGSNIGFVLAAKGPIVEKARKYTGHIPQYAP